MKNKKAMAKASSFLLILAAVSVIVLFVNMASGIEGYSAFFENFGVSAGDDSAWTDSGTYFTPSTTYTHSASYSERYLGPATAATLTKTTAIDLSGKVNGNVTYWGYVVTAVDNNEFCCIDLYDGNTWDNGVIDTSECADGAASDNPEGSWFLGWHEIPSNCMVSNFQIRIRCTTAGAGTEDIYIDDINVTYDLLPTVSITAPTDGYYNTSQTISGTCTAGRTLSAAYTNRTEYGGIDTTPATFSFANTSAIANGRMNIRIYCNDTANNTGNTDAFYWLDTIKPNSAILSPNATHNNLNTTTFNLLEIAKDETQLNHIWYQYGSSANTTLANGANTSVTKLEDANLLLLWINDSAGNYNNTPPYTVNIDTQPPNTTIDNQSGISLPYGHTIMIQGTCTDDGIADLHSAYTNSTYFTAVDDGVAVDGIFNLTNTSTLPDTAYNIYVFCNDSYGNNLNFSKLTFTIDVIYINVELVKPPPSALVAKDFVFNVNSTVKCKGGNCGNVNAKLRYNATTNLPDTDVPTSEATPMYIIDSPNQQNCFYNPLEADDFCNITWKVKATGNIDESYKISAVFSSDSADVRQNQTANHTVKIVSCVVDIMLHWSAIEFGDSEPGTAKAAPDNGNRVYNISSDSTCKVDLYIKGSNLTGKDYPDYNISVSNLTWNNASDDYASSWKLDFDWLPINNSVWANTNNTQYFWLEVPREIMAGAYEGNITIEGVENGLAP